MRRQSLEMKQRAPDALITKVTRYHREDWNEMIVQLKSILPGYHLSMAEIAWYLGKYLYQTCRMWNPIVKLTAFTGQGTSP